MIWQVVEVSWIVGITFLKMGSGVNIGQKTSVLKDNCEYLKFILQQQIHETTKDRLKIIILFWLSFEGCNCEVVTFPLVSWVRWGALLYRLLIFVLFLTLYNPALTLL